MILLNGCRVIKPKIGVFWCKTVPTSGGCPLVGYWCYCTYLTVVPCTHSCIKLHSAVDHPAWSPHEPEMYLRNTHLPTKVSNYRLVSGTTLCFEPISALVLTSRLKIQDSNIERFLRPITSMVESANVDFWRQRKYLSNPPNRPCVFFFIPTQLFALPARRVAQS